MDNGRVAERQQEGEKCDTCASARSHHRCSYSNNSTVSSAQRVSVIMQCFEDATRMVIADSTSFWMPWPGRSRTEPHQIKEKGGD
jgi:hypothetical protein